ncbi:MAG: DUF2855 family protein [Hyphomonadaceae bacterium]|nr:DUF2855 family protein [Hyphomonadaceae bacterium]
MNATLIVNKTDFRDTTLKDAPIGDLADGNIRVDIGPFALTANNITYMVTGDMIGYWKFFDPAAYGIESENAGRMPVWGYGKVVESKCESVPVGSKIYGFFPIANQIDMKPVKFTPVGFQDGADHRVDLHSIYNSYTMVDKDPSFNAAFEELQPILRPLFTTSFLIDDMFADADFYGAEQIVILSASSKTALGTAYCLNERDGPTVVGLTSKGNIDFVEKTGFYNQVVSYDDITSLDTSKKTALIDMAGNGDIMGKVYDHIGNNIVYNCMVGKSHWQGGTPPKITAGAPPTMFFAPDRAKQRFADWGPEGFAKNLGARWVPFCVSAKSWMRVESHTGEAALMRTYKELLDGKADPSLGQLFTL